MSPYGEGFPVDDLGRAQFGTGDPAPNFAVADANEGFVVDSLDDMQPVPRAGKFFAERILRKDIATEAGVLLQTADDPDYTDMRTARALVLQLGQPRDGESWDFAAGWHVIVPYHAGHEFEWMSQGGVTESLWIVDTNEVIALLRPR